MQYGLPHKEKRQKPGGGKSQRTCGQTCLTHTSAHTHTAPHYTHKHLWADSHEGPHSVHASRGGNAFAAYKCISCITVPSAVVQSDVHQASAQEWLPGACKWHNLAEEWIRHIQTSHYLIRPLPRMTPAPDPASAPAPVPAPTLPCPSLRTRARPCFRLSSHPLLPTS